jgi:hypothetical protein
MSRDSSKLLIDEYPLQVLPTLAKKVGLNRAIVLQQVHYWLVIAKKAKDDRKFIDGAWWVYNTYDEWQENFPWWSLPTIKRTIYSLEASQLLLSKEMGAKDWDHTKWYTINYVKLNDLIDCINMNQSDDSDRVYPADQDDTFLNSNTETTAETTAERIISLFTNYFGKFYSKKEQIRWTAICEAAGYEQSEKFAEWAFKKEIHLVNRGGLLDSLETAAKNWKGSQATFPASNLPKGAAVAASWLAKRKASANGN